MPNSFRIDAFARPSHYRTPSPPHDAFEPLLSPGQDVSESHPLRNERNSASEAANNHQPLSETRIDLSSENRFKDTMSFFADIALSTQISTNKRALDNLENLGPATKRARSEKLPSPEISIGRAAVEARPVTSHEQNTQSRMSDAELLLSFSQLARHASHGDPDIAEDIVDRASSHELKDSKPARSSPASFLRQLKEASKGSPFAELPFSSTKRDVPANSDDHRPTASKDDFLSWSADKDSQIAPASNGAVSLPHSHSNQQVQIVPVPDENGRANSHHGGDSDSQHSVQGIAGAGGNNLVTSEVEEAGLKTKNGDSIAICAACKFARNSLSIEGESNATSWISCDACKNWFHFACAGFKNEREVRSVDKYRCKKCKPIHGATTYVRKSSRAHTAIDYAGLHQGVLKTSDDRMEHHYIQPIKEGIITFNPENFARMRPELVTAEFFEKGGGMKEPIVIPAEFNLSPRSLCGQNELGRSAEGLESASDGLSGEGDCIMGEAEDQYVPDDGQDALDMVIPGGLTVRHVAELYGPEEKVEVIDVKSQNGEGKKWNMRRWADYYENPNNKVVRNVISLEVSQSRLGRLIRRPKIVRDLDLQDSVWPEELLTKGEFPRVQFYTLMSVADCFTDFHIDFGGSSVFYHILKGKKTFLFIPPKEKHLKKYEEWCMSPAQNWTFLADQTKECYRVDLSEGDTMLIPSGWIHAVWTPEDSLVIGGNFLTRMNFGMQLRVAQVEKTTGVARKFRYPHFQKIHWYTVMKYLKDDPLPESVKELLHGGESFKRDVPTHHEFDAWGENSRSGKGNHHAKYYSQQELEGFPDLVRYLLRTALIDSGSITDGITAETRNAVKKSIPRGHGEPLEIVKNFATWCAWKRGNEPIPHWAYPDAEPESLVSDKLSAAAMKKLDCEAAREAASQAPRRTSARRLSQQQKAAAFSHEPLPEQIKLDDSVPTVAEISMNDYASAAQIGTPTSLDSRKHESSMNSLSSSRKTACEACRKRRRACKHKDQVLAQSLTIGASLPNSNLESLSGSLLGHPDSSTTDSSMPGVGTVFGVEEPDTINILDRTLSKMSADLANINQDMGAPSNEMITTRQLEGVSDMMAFSVNSATPVRPRTKACNECRKSKRRCVHDAFGNEDPVKVAEQAIPRPHARKNRKVNDGATNTKPAEIEEITELESPTMRAPVANMMAAAIPTETSNATFLTDTSTSPSNDYRNDPERMGQVSNPSSPETTAGTVAPEVPGASTIAASIESVVGTFPKISREEESHDNLDSHAEIPTIEANTINDNNVEQPVSASFLMSPPASSHDDRGNSPTNNASTHTPSPPTSRPSSKQPHKEPPIISPSTRSQQQEHQQQQRNTPESGSLRRGSSSSFEQVNKSDKPNEAAIVAAANDTEQQQIASKPSSQKYRTTRRPSEAALADADEESIRLIKELQAQDLGLRRRGATKT